MRKVSLNRLTRIEAAEYIGCSEATFNKLLKEGYLKNTFYSVLGRRFFITEKLQEWMQAGGCEAFKNKKVI